MTTPAFIDWLKAEIDERADGSIKVFAHLITMSETAVKEWTKGRAAPSKRGCRKLGRVTGLPWRTIGQMAGSRYIGGVGNALHEADQELELPEDVPVGRLQDINVLESVYPGCDGCDRYKHRTGAYFDRESYYCCVLVNCGLPPLCYAWSPFDEWRVARMVLDA
jgi:hypothetical protein